MGNNAGWISASRSLFLTGLADVLSGLKEPRGGESARSGLPLMVTSAAAFAAMAAFAKKLLPETPTQAVVFSRGAMMTIVFVAMARRQRVSLLGTRPGMLFLRGLLGYVALSCYFWTVHRLPLGDAVLLQYSHPLFVAMLAPALLREKPGRGHWLLVGTALIGVAFIVGPSGEIRTSALVGVAGSFLSALAYMTVRELARTEHPLRILAWFPLATLPFSFVATLFAGRSAIPSNATEVLGHLLVTASALVGQIALTLGLARSGAARATAVTLTGPVFGLIFGYLLFGTVPGPWSVAGTTVVLAALAMLGWGGTGDKNRLRAADP